MKAVLVTSQEEINFPGEKRIPENGIEETDLRL
jgi:hypothetical protein